MFFKIHYQIYQQVYQQLYYFKRHDCRSNASRSSCYFWNRLNFQYKFKRLLLSKKWKAGRNDSGRIILWTKSALLKHHYTPQINYKLSYRRLGFIAGFQFIPFKNRLLSLFYFANGAVTYYLTAEPHTFFIFYLISSSYRKFKKFKFEKIILMLCQIKKLSFVSCVEIKENTGAQYVRSPGTQAKIIKFDKENRTVLLELPSDDRKLFSYFSFVLLGKISMSLHSRCMNTKSGYWRSFGIKSIVRGVAMNPVDHPHGGRTKAIRHQRTPWGKTTKLK